MSLAWSDLFGSLLLFVGMLLACEGGRRLGRRRRRVTGNTSEPGIGAAEAAVFALLGLLIAFTFSGAAERFERRRELITLETNAIGTAWLRLELLAADVRPAVQQVFRDYVDARIASFDHGLPATAQAQAETRAQVLQREIWQLSHSTSQRPDHPPPAAMLLLPALNEMFDVTTTRVAATRNHPPFVIFGLLCALSLVASLLIGYGAAGQARRPWFYQVTFAAILALVAFVIVDLEFPRKGLIRVDDADLLLKELRATMGAVPG